MTTRAIMFAVVICLAPAAARAQTPAADLPKLSTSISEQSAKVVLNLDAGDQGGQTASKPAPQPSTKSDPAPYKKSHWGVSASFTPKWKMWGKISTAIADDGQTWTVEGTQFTAGLVHGRSLGGDFGVDYVSQPVKNGTTTVPNVATVETQCTGSNSNNTTPPCFTLHSSDITDNVKMAGVKVHFYIPFVTIKKRVQVGINIGAGVAQLSGNVISTEQNLQFVPNPSGPGGTFKVVTTTDTKSVKDVFDLPIVPLFDFDIAVGFIITPAIKVRYMGGIGIPGQKNFQLLGTYLFGAH